MLEFNRIIFFITVVFGLEEVMDNTFSSGLRSRAKEMPDAMSAMLLINARL